MNYKRVLSKAPQTLVIPAGVLIVLLDRKDDSKSSASCFCETTQRSPPEKSTGGIQHAPAPSWIRKSLAAIYLTSLPLPRKIVPGDSALQDSRLRRGIRQRQQDERMLRSLQAEIHQAQQSRDTEQIRRLFEQVTEIAYGKGVTPQIREDFIVRYGCTGWNDAILDKLINLASSRGIVEIGAGHGQWARALTERYNLVVKEKMESFDFCLAYDSMTELPLSTKVYHRHTQPAHEYFFPNVQQCNDVSSVFRKWTTRGRVLLLVFPPPGDMALETIKSYVEMGPENDTVVYVGEGRGGATADDALFDYLESGDWQLVDVIDVKSQPGGKGYEKLFILRRTS